MKVFTAPTSKEIGKFQGLIKAFPNVWEGSILDVGCRSKGLKQVLLEQNGNVNYCGLDLYPPADLIGNLEVGLPFDDSSFDTVTALDVLEHIEEIHNAFKELCRVSRKYILVTLPNAYEVKSRIKFLFGRPLSGKHGLPVRPPQDRHRWLFSFREARNFTHTLGRRYGFELIAEGCLIGPRRSFAVNKVAVSLFPNFLSPCYVACLQRKN
jgi:hypothetical protein